MASSEKQNLCEQPEVTSQSAPRATTARTGAAAELEMELDAKALREIEKKKRLMELDRDKKRARASHGASASSSSSSVAPGQHLVNKWVVLDLGHRPDKSAHDPWREGEDFGVHFHGLGDGGERSRRVTLRELRAACPNAEWARFDSRDWHCVTGWSARGLSFRGVPLSTITALLSPRADWRCLFQRSADGYAVGVHVDECANAFLAVTDGDGEVLSEEHGGPRLVFPDCYGWKSAKFLSSIEFTADASDAARGFWEKLGCHPRGRWAREERWAPGASNGVWTVLAWITGLYRKLFGERVWELVMVHGGRALGAGAAVAERVAGVFRGSRARARPRAE